MATLLFRCLAVALVACVTPLALAQAMSPSQRDALNAAEVWLVRVDKQQYGPAWQAAAESFRTSVSRRDWNDGIARLRKEYGRFVSRKGEKIACVGEAPGTEGVAKPGMKIVIHFDTKFAGNKAATEEVTMTLEGDGVWRPMGYYIQ